MTEAAGDRNRWWQQPPASLTRHLLTVLRRVMGEMEPLSDDEHARREALRSEFEGIEQRYFQESDEDLPEEIDRRLAEIEVQLDAFEERPVHYDPDEVSRAGAFVSIIPVLVLFILFQRYIVSNQVSEGVK